jgi:hypothetical protein
MTGVKYAKANLKASSVSTPCNQFGIDHLRRHHGSHEHECTGYCQQWLVGQSPSPDSINIQSPQFQVAKMLCKQYPSQTVGYGIPSIVLNPLFHEIGIDLREKSLLVRCIGEVNEDEPGRKGNDLGDQALDNLLLVSFFQYSRSWDHTKIHCQALRPPTPSIPMRPYARTFDNPPTVMENK